MGLALVILGLARAGALVAHEPLAGYANQYDMHRTGACVGLFPAIDGPARYQATPSAPIARYVGEAPREGCYPSTETALVTAVAVAADALRPDATTFRLQWVGFAKLGLLALVALSLAWFLRRHPAATLLHGLTLLLVLADPAVTLWFNTLYTEFTVVWGLYAAIGAACALALEEDPPLAAWLLLGAGLVALAFSKEQFAWLPVAFAAVAAPWLWIHSRAATVATLVLALGSAVASMLFVPRPDAVARVNRTNVYLGVVAPAFGDPARALRELGLPERCAPLVGASWYLQRGEPLETTCPEVFALPSTAFLRQAGEPAVLARAMARVLPAAQHVVPPYLGVLEGARHAGLRDLPAWLASPLDAIASRTPFPAFAAATIALFLLAPLAGMAALAWARPAAGEPRAGLLFAMLLGGTALHAAITTVFGDGLSEAARHYAAGLLATFAGLLALAVALVRVPLAWMAEPKRAAWELAAILGGAIVVVAAIAFTLQWARVQPLAIGVLDVPGDRRWPAGGLVLRGWALDPQGVARVEVVLGALRRDARYGAEPTPDLAAVFPGYPDAGRGRFTLELDANDVAAAVPGGNLQVLVHGRTGTVTPVDARRLEAAP